MRAAAAGLSVEVERIVEETGFERIHIIGHSLGGLIARYYVTRLGGDARVHTLITLGTPHEGSYAAYAVPTTLMQQMRPGSHLMRELDRPVRGCRTRFISYWSDNDWAIHPQRNAALRHRDLGARNIKLHGAGHLTLPMLRRGRARHLDRPGPPRRARRHGHLRRHPPGPRRVTPARPGVGAAPV